MYRFLATALRSGPPYIPSSRWTSFKALSLLVRRGRHYAPVGGVRSTFNFLAGRSLRFLLFLASVGTLALPPGSSRPLIVPRGRNVVSVWVQTFYAWRIYRLGRWRVIPVIIIIVSNPSRVGMTVADRNDDTSYRPRLHKQAAHVQLPFR